MNGLYAATMLYWAGDGAPSGYTGPQVAGKTYPDNDQLVLFSLWDSDDRLTLPMHDNCGALRRVAPRRAIGAHVPSDRPAATRTTHTHARDLTRLVARVC